jgi:hypothetical protein
MPRSIRLAGLLLGLCFSLVDSAQADPVTHWNGITLTAVSHPTAGRGGPPGLLDIALVQAAVHDAVQVIEGRFQPYHYSDPSKLGVGSTAAAVAAASRGVLVRLYPSQAGTPAQPDTIEGKYEAYKTANGLHGNAGLAIGEAAAKALYDDHYRPVLTEGIVNPSNLAVGQWRGPVLGFQYLATSRPFTLESVDQFRPQPPPPLTSMQYTRDYNEVKLLGLSSNHPNDTTGVARFWAGNFVFQWNETLRQIADAQTMSVGDGARLFALANLAAADAAIAVWDSKVFYNFWRPVTGIAEGDNDGNARTVGVPATGVPWTALIGTPPYPDYVSGANGLTGAFTGLLRLFFGTDSISFSVKNLGVPAGIANERHFTSCSQAAQEVVDARVLLGIHFRFADEEGRRLGQRVAHWTFQQFLRPVAGSQN